MGAEELSRSLRGRISDERVLAAIAAVPREKFVSPAQAFAAYHDVPLPIGGGQTISQPTVVARMCEILELRPTDRVLDVGTGSGYHAAVMASMCEHVWGIECDPQLVAHAEHALAEADITNVTVIVGDGTLGLPEQAPFDAVNVAATSRRDVPPALLEQLAVGGRLVAPIAAGGGEHLVFVRRGPDGLERRTLDSVRFVPLR